MADWARVQGSADVTAGNSSITLSAIGKGNIISAGCTIDTGRNVILTDNTGANTYDAFPSDDDGTIAAFVFKPRVPITNSPTVFTFTADPAGSTPTNFQKVIDEFSLPSGAFAISFDGGQSVVGNSGAFTGLAATDSPVFQNRQPDALIWGFATSNGTITTGAGFTAGSTATAGAITILSNWKIQASATTSNKLSFGSQTGTMWGGVMAVAPVAANSWVPIQNARLWPGASGAGFWVSFAKPATKGNMLVGEFFPNSGSFAELATFTDDKGGAYTFLTPQPAGRSLFWSGGLLTSAPQVFIGTLSPSDAVGVFMTEFMPPPGTASVVVDGGGAVGTNVGSNAATMVTSSSIATTKGGALVYSGVEPAGHSGCVPLNGIAVTGGAGRSLANGYIIQPASGPIGATWDIASGAANLTMFQVAFRSN